MTRGRTLVNAVAAAAVMALSVGSVAGQAPYKVAKTPWGEPDLQGVYNGNDLQGVPMQRAESVGIRTMLNDEEYKQRVAARDNLLASDNEGFDIEDSEKFERFGAVGGPVSPPPHWLERSSGA